MKRTLLLISVLAIFCLPVLTTHAQKEDNLIAYGDTAAGEITNANFEAVFTFEGKADDVVVIQLVASDTASFDPYLYLTTGDNELVAENDDYNNLNSRIVTILPEDGTYQIIAARLGERTGTGEGAFTLTLESSQTSAVGVAMEGTVEQGEEAPSHIFAVETDGLYTITYNVVRGDYYPSLRVDFLGSDADGYIQEIGRLGAEGLQGGSITLQMEADGVYIFSLEEMYYSDLPITTPTVYTIKVDATAKQ